ncbi:MAG: tetratricopeptide repeat protein [Bacteroidota bacterium]|nr:tetratricopeptide repeat protein [Bacteroidota bacterium]
MKGGINNTILCNRWLIVLIGILLLVFLVYSNSINNSFTNRDDKENVLKNNDIKALSLTNLKNIFTSSYLGMYSPLTMVSYAIDYSIKGLNPHMFHLTNLILHLFNCMLVFLLFRVITGNLFISGFVALLFGIHPLNVDGVSSISVRGSLLYSFFYLLSLIMYVCYTSKGNKPKYLFISIFLFVLSGLSKSTAITLPFVLLLIDWYMQRKMDPGVLIEKIQYLIFALIFGFLTIVFRQEAGHESNILMFSFIDRVLIRIYSLVFYPLNFLIPFKLSVLHLLPDDFKLPLIYYISIFVLIVIIVLLYLNRHNRVILFGFALFFIQILLMIVRPPYGNEIVAGRYAYLPFLGFYFISGYYTEKLSEKYKKPVYVFISAYVLVLCFMTYNRNKVWVNSIELWTDALHKYPQMGLGYNARGMAKSDSADYQGAIVDFNRALEIRSCYDEAFYNRGNALLQLKDTIGALKDYYRAVECNPHNTEAYLSIGKINIDKNNFRDALVYFNLAIKYKPDEANAYINRGLLYSKTGQNQKAMDDYNKCLSIDISNSIAYLNRGNIKRMLNDYQGAINDYDNAILYDPNDAYAYNDRGTTELLINDFSNAIKDFDYAIKISPSYKDAYFNRGYAKLISNDFRGALKDFEKVISLNPKDMEAVKLKEKILKTINN